MPNNGNRGAKLFFSPVFPLKLAKRQQKTDFLGRFFRLFLAVPTGFEPAISALTGPHVRPLHHGTSFLERAVVYHGGMLMSIHFTKVIYSKKKYLIWMLEIKNTNELIPLRAWQTNQKDWRNLAPGLRLQDNLQKVVKNYPFILGVLR